MKLALHHGKKPQKKSGVSNHEAGASPRGMKMEKQKSGVRKIRKSAKIRGQKSGVRKSGVKNQGSGLRNCETP
jgi:hypothetical protein